MRIPLFFATNIAVLVLLAFVCRVLGVEEILAGQGVGINLTGLLAISAVFGMSGSVISLFLSKFLAKRRMGLHVIEDPRTQVEQWLVATVRRHAEQSGIGMPEVAIYDAPQPNAFATGARKDAALVAVSTGLLRNMKAEEVDGVLAHEVSHIANGDMVTLALVQGVLNTFVFFLARVIGIVVDRVVFRSEDSRGGGIGYFAVVIVAQIALGLLANMIVMWFSRFREFRADAGGARLAGPDRMIGALERLKSGPNEPLPDALAAFGITGGGFARLFATHPSLDDRIARLKQDTGLLA